MTFKKIAFISLTLLTLNIAEARPISWSGGSTLMYKSNSMFTSYYYHYSPSYKYSIGAEYIDDKYFIGISEERVSRIKNFSPTHDYKIIFFYQVKNFFFIHKV